MRGRPAEEDLLRLHPLPGHHLLFTAGLRHLLSRLTVIVYRIDYNI